jgi:16S rRNA (guanine527-N7)-methyltransferase
MGVSLLSGQGMHCNSPPCRQLCRNKINLPQPTTVSRETQERLDIFERLLIRWGRSLNLVSADDRLGNLHTRHIEDSLALVPYIPPTLDRLIDLGSGAGLPAIPIAIVVGCHVDLIESDRRKAAFLQTALATIGLPGTVWPERIEKSNVPPASVITARALAPLTILLAYTHPILKKDGFGLFAKGERAEAEIREARKKWHMEVDILPGSAKHSRILKISGLEPVHAANR